MSKFLNGDVRLVISYWIVGCLGTVVVRFIYTALISSRPGFGVVTFLSLLLYAWAAFVLIGIWRSATKYEGPKFWSILAKIMVGIGTLSAVVSFIRFLQILSKI